MFTVACSSLQLHVILVLLLILIITFANVGNVHCEECHPFLTVPEYSGEIPDFYSVLGYDFGEIQATVEDLYLYFETVGNASDRVLGPFDSPFRSVNGIPLKYVLVSSPENLANVEEIQEKMKQLMNPQETPIEDAYEIAENTPGFVWIASAVHGNEPSGADSSSRILYHLTDRIDCAATQILDNVIVVIMPTQNPDGRIANVRRNANGFDMNRDWFAQTQPETKGKVELISLYPPLLFLDTHEMGALTYFMPPNADPYYHEHSAESVMWINDLYGAAMAEEFDRLQIPYFNEDSFDLFYAGFGDSFPTLSYGGAGITLEKCRYDNYPEKEAEQYIAQWAGISAAATNKSQILKDWYDSFAEAIVQGENGILQPNRVYNEGNEVELEVDNITVRTYFLFNNDISKQYEFDDVIEKLEKIGVEIEYLSAPLLVNDFVYYGRERSSVTLPIGTAVISLAQPRKHFIQGMLNEDTYAPFPYFYDMTCWSLPLLSNIRGGYSSLSTKEFQQHLFTSQNQPPSNVINKDKNENINIAVLLENQAPLESFDWLVFTLKQWGFTPIIISAIEFDTTPDVLDGIDVLLVPDIASPQNVYNLLGEDGRNAILSFLQQPPNNNNSDGLSKRYISIQGGAQLAALLGISDVYFEFPTRAACPGALFRAIVDESHPLSLGVGSELFQYFDDFYGTMHIDDSSSVISFIADANSDDWYVSGYHENGEDIGGSIVAAIEKFEGDDDGDNVGFVISFGLEINYRSFTVGTAKMLYNAITSTNLSSSSSSSSNNNNNNIQRQDQGKTTTTTTILSSSTAFKIVVSLSNSVIAVDDILSMLKQTVTRFQNVINDDDDKNVKVSLLFENKKIGKASFLISNPSNLDIDEHRWISMLSKEMKKSFNIDIISIRRKY